MAMGLSCITTDFPSGAAEILVSNNINGIIIPTGDTEQLSFHLQRLIDNAELRTDLQQNAVGIRSRLAKKQVSSQWISFMESKNK